MNSDLAYCLERFIDDQIQMIDDYLETVKDKETAEYHRIEQMKVLSTTKRKPPMNKGSHDEDATIVQHFLASLRDIANTTAGKEVKKYREMLHAEFSAKIDDCENHLIRLRNLAEPMRISISFVVHCDETIKRLQQGRKTPENFDQLDRTLDQSDYSNVVQNIQHWWEKTYGSAVMKIINLNKGFNPAIGNRDIAVVTPWSQMIDCGKQILEARKKEVATNSSKKYKLVWEFVREIQSIDEENRREINGKDLINQLYSSDLDFAKNYAEIWLNKRDAVRNEKIDDDCYDVLLQETKVQFERQRIAQESKKLALASLLRRLAIGSENTEQFDQKLKTTLQKQKQKDGLPIITGDIGEPSVDKLAISIHLENADIKEWSNNSNQIQDKFSIALCHAFLIPVGAISITGIESGDSTIRAYVSPPYGTNVIDSLNGTAPDSPTRVAAVRECCLALKGKVESITLGEFGLSIDRKLMDPTWNRKYLWSKSDDDDEGEYWKESMTRGGRPYFCPSGWFRFGIKVAENDKEFDALWGDWYLAYHGTQSAYAVDILTSGLRVSTSGCYYVPGVPRVYVSPSIEYCAHKRYAKPWTKAEKNGKTRWFQMVFQCRVNPKAVEKMKAETLLNKDYKEKVTIDSSFTNKELEWIIPGKEGTRYMNHDIICYGLMMRISDVDPEQLPTSAWWKYVHK